MPFKTAVQIFPSEAPSEALFYITATQAVGRSRRTLKDGDTFAVLDSYGDIVATPGSPDGLFYQDTRHLSHLELLINENTAAWLQYSRRQHRVLRGFDESRPDRRATHRHGEGPRTYSAHHLHLA